MTKQQQRKSRGQTATREPGTDQEPEATRAPERPEAMRPRDPKPVEEGHAHQSAIDAGRSATEEEAEERQKKLREDAGKLAAEADKEAERERAEAERRRRDLGKVVDTILRHATKATSDDQTALAGQEQRELEGKARADLARAEEVKRALEGDRPHPAQEALESDWRNEELADWQTKLAEHYRLAAEVRAERAQLYVQTGQAAEAEREREPDENPAGDEGELQLGVATEEDELVLKRPGPGPDPGPPEGREDEPTMYDVRPGREPGREVPPGGAAPGVPSGHARPWQDRRGEPGHFKAADIQAAEGEPAVVDKFAEHKPRPHEIANAMITAAIVLCRDRGTGDDYILVRNSLTLANRMLGRQWHRMTGRHEIRRKREEAAAKATEDRA